MPERDPNALPCAHGAEAGIAGVQLLDRPFADTVAAELRPEEVFDPLARDILEHKRKALDRREAFDSSVYLAQMDSEERGALQQKLSMFIMAGEGVHNLQAARQLMRAIKGASLDRKRINAIDAWQGNALNGRDLEAQAMLEAQVREVFEPATDGQELQILNLSVAPPPVGAPLVGKEGQQLVMPGDVVAFASDPGAGKTMKLLALAEGIASGGTVLGFKCQQAPVLYLSSDGDPHVHQKLERLWNARGPGKEGLSDLPLAVVVDDDFNLGEDAHFSRLLATLEHFKFDTTPSVLILESLATNVDGHTDINDQQQVRQWARVRLRSLQARFPGLTILLSAHLKKRQAQGINDLGSRVAGSVQIRAAVDALIGLVATGKEAFTVHQVKRSRSGGSFDGFGVRIEGEYPNPISLVNTGLTETSIEELRGAGAAIIQYMQAGHERAPLASLAEALRGSFRLRAVQAAAKRLAESDPPRLVRVSKKPAVYALLPHQAELEECD